MRVRGFREGGGLGADRDAVKAFQSPKWVGSVTGGTQPPGCFAVQCSRPIGFPYGWCAAAGAVHGAVVPQMVSLIGGTRPLGR